MLPEASFFARHPVEDLLDFSSAYGSVSGNRKRVFLDEIVGVAEMKMFGANLKTKKKYELLKFIKRRMKSL